MTPDLRDALTREALSLGFDSIGIADPDAIAGVREGSRRFSPPARMARWHG